MMELEKELKQKMEEITPIDRQVMEAAWKNWDGLCKPLRGLGWLEEALVQIAGIMRDDRPHPDKRAVVIMGADNGVVKEGVTQTDQSVTMQVLENMGNDLSTACVMSHQAGCDMILFDCLTAYTSNLLCSLDNIDDSERNYSLLREACQSLIDAVKKSNATMVVVTNEVGAGIVPENHLAREFRDLAGLANQLLAAASEEVYFTVAGIPVNIKKLAENW